MVYLHVKSSVFDLLIFKEFISFVEVKVVHFKFSVSSTVVTFWS